MLRTCLMPTIIKAVKQTNGNVCVCVCKYFNTNLTQINNMSYQHQHLTFCDVTKQFSCIVHKRKSSIVTITNCFFCVSVVAACVPIFLAEHVHTSFSKSAS